MVHDSPTRRQVVEGFGERIRRARQAKGIKQVALARQAGISASYLSEIETAQSGAPSAVIVLRLAEALGSTVAELLDLPSRPRAAPLSASRWSSELAQLRQIIGASEDELVMLSRIEVRGRRPKTLDDWIFLLLAVRRAIG